jgi:hypothetical protein|tara:strand:+ start:68 stop:322 length:255 start_codon:yes stop_codon:yes gene_type:complete
MKDIKKNRYLLKKNSYIIDLFNVDFITWKENEKEEGTYWVKLHMGNKEARYVSRDIDDLQLLLIQWTNVRGLEIEIEIDEIKGD